MRVAIHSDDYTNPARTHERDASSPLWETLLTAKKCEVKRVNLLQDNVLEQLKGCDALMWRWAHFGGMYRPARRILRVVEEVLGLVVYPDQKTCWHYDDKIAQIYLFRAHGIPHPRSWIWFDHQLALEWIEQLSDDSLPIVVKLATGAGASNVQLARTRKELGQYCSLMFEHFSTDLKKLPRLLSKVVGLQQRIPIPIILGKRLEAQSEPQRGYLFCQEFLADNSYDTRVTVIGNRAFAFQRKNREKDFRASGSGAIEWEEKRIDRRIVQLAFRVADALNMTSCAIDCIYDESRNPVVVEVSYTYASWAVEACPGHWFRDSASGNVLTWVDAPMAPEEAQVECVLSALERRSSAEA